MTRKQPPKDNQTKVLHSSRRICAICFEYDGGVTRKLGQLAHIDRNPNNNKESNLVFLCNDHHSEYDIKSTQSKMWTEGELKIAKKMLEAFTKESSLITWPGRISLEKDEKDINPAISKDEKYQKITADIYNLRIPIYYAYREFVSKVLREDKFDARDLLEFAKKTDQALFLYDEEVADYMSETFKKGWQLQYTKKLLNTTQLVKDNKKRAMYFDKETELIDWFSDHYEKVRQMFKPYLYLG